MLKKKDARNLVHAYIYSHLTKEVFLEKFSNYFINQGYEKDSELGVLIQEFEDVLGIFEPAVGSPTRNDLN